MFVLLRLATACIFVRLVLASAGRATTSPVMGAEETRTATIGSRAGGALPFRDIPARKMLSWATQLHNLSVPEFAL